MTLRKKIFIISGIGGGLLISLLLIIYLRGNQNNIPSPFAVEEDVDVIVVEEPTSNGDLFIPTNRVITDTRQAINQTPDEIYTKQLASIFVERFGSYSNQSSFSNINDLKMLMSKKMQRWAENYVREQKEQAQAADIYYGITTKAVAGEVEEFDDDAGKAVILVRTRRREALGTTVNISNAYNQDALITFVKEDGAWKVDSAVWKN